MKKKGFTLVELMGVITVLGLITLLVAPTIINQIRNSKDKIDSVTEKLIFSATELYLDNKENDYPKLNGSTYCLTLKDLVEDGKLSSPLLDSNGDEISLDKIIAVDVINNSYSYAMSNSCEPKLGGTLRALATTSEELNVTEVNACAIRGTECMPGTAFAIKVNKEEIYKFYVLNDSENIVTLIMDRKLGEDVQWISIEDYIAENNKDETPDTCVYDVCNDEGPITAIKELKQRTAGWDYIPSKPYTFDGTHTYTEDGQVVTQRVYDDITLTMKARMITLSEDQGCTAQYDSCPSWLNDHIENTEATDITGSWMSTATTYIDLEDETTNFNGVWYMYENRIGYMGHLSGNLAKGIRPVIELSK